MNLIDITKILIITKNNFNDLLIFLNITLLETESNYTVAYLLANIFALIFIYFIIKAIIATFYIIFGKRKGVLL